MKIIARIKSDFPSKFGIPRQSGIISSLKAKVIFEPEFRNPDLIKGLEDYSHLWLIWEFSKAKREHWSATVRPPRLGGNKRVGVFASRSPFRPNPIGLSSVKLDKVEILPTMGPVLYVSGADLMDGTPIYDIKPYLPYVDSHPEAKGGFSDLFSSYSLKVVCSDDCCNRVPEDIRESLFEILAQDPRPSYQEDPDRIYGLPYAGYNVRFRVKDETLHVLEIEEMNNFCEGNEK